MRETQLCQGIIGYKTRPIHRPISSNFTKTRSNCHYPPKITGNRKFLLKLEELGIHLVIYGCEITSHPCFFFCYFILYISKFMI